MASRTRTILGAIKSAIAGIDGSGSYTYDLSGNGVVQLGVSAGQEARSPAVWICLASLESENARTLGRYTRRLSVYVEAWISPTVDTPDERICAGADLLNDLCMALEANRSLVVGGSAQVRDLVVRGMSGDGNEVGAPGLAFAAAFVDCHWDMNSGAGL